MKKSLILMLFIVVFVVACSSPATNEETPAPAVEETMKLTWVPLVVPVDKDGVIVKHMEEKFNVDVDLWNDDGEALKVRIASGDTPDRMEVFVADYNRFIDQGLLAEIPLDMIQKHAPNLYKQYMEDFNEGVMNFAKKDGKIYGLPNGNPESGGARRAIAWRGDWLENVGITKVPETLAEMETAVYKFAKNDPDKNKKNDTFGLSSSMMEAVYGAYGYLPDQWHMKDGKLVYGGIQPEMKDALKLLRKWYADKVIAPEFVAEDESKGGPVHVSIPFTQGKIGTSAHDSFLQWKIGRYEGDREGDNVKELRNNNPNGKIVYGTPPIGSNGKRGVKMEPQLHTRFLSFGKQVENDPAKMQKLLEMTDYSSATLDGFLISRFGTEGTHWNWKTDGDVKIPVPIEPFNDWMQITAQGGGITFSAIWLPRIISEVNSEYMWRMKEQPGLNEHGYINEASHIFTDSGTKYSDELKTLRMTAYRDIITGAKPLDSFDEFVKQWKASGGDVLTTDFNAAYEQMNK
jgi:putative aldouronate transport system substrate-binding protein